MNRPQGVFVALQQQTNEISRNPEGSLTTRDTPAWKTAGLQHRCESDGVNLPEAGLLQPKPDMNRSSTVVSKNDSR